MTRIQKSTPVVRAKWEDVSAGERNRERQRKRKPRYQPKSQVNSPVRKPVKVKARVDTDVEYTHETGKSSQDVNHDRDGDESPVNKELQSQPHHHINHVDDVQGHSDSLISQVGGRMRVDNPIPNI